MHIRKALPLLLLTVWLGGSDKDSSPTAPPEPTLSSASQSEVGLTWSDNNDITMDTKWKLLSLSENGLEISWILDVTNKSFTRSYDVSIGRLVFEDEEGFQLAERKFSFGVEDFSIGPNTSRTRQGVVTVDIYDIDIANSISKMGVWVGFTVQ